MPVIAPIIPDDVSITVSEDDEHLSKEKSKLIMKMVFRSLAFVSLCGTVIMSLESKEKGENLVNNVVLGGFAGSFLSSTLIGLIYLKIHG